MASEDIPGRSLEHLALVPLDEQVAPEKPATADKPLIDTRHKSDRRVLADRRSSVRFQEPRRSNKDRRPVKNYWGPGTDL
jgi:hypothetical protein